MAAKSKSTSAKALLILTIILIIAFMYLIKDYFSMVVVAFVTTLAADPLYRYLGKYIKNRSLAAIATTLILLLIIIIPLCLIAYFFISEIIVFLKELNEGIKNGSIDLARFNKQYEELLRLFPQEPEQITQSINQNLENITNTFLGFFRNFLVPTVMNIILFFVRFFIFLTILIYLFPDREKIFNYIADIQPLEKKYYLEFIEEFRLVSQAFIYRSGLGMLLQGVLGYIAFIVVGFPIPILWSIILAFSSLIPNAAGAITFLLSAYLAFIEGKWPQAIFLFLWSIIVISGVDIVIGTKIMSKTTKGLPELLVLISLLGGLSVFGILGLIYGPLIAAFLYTSLNIYKKAKLKK